MTREEFIKKLTQCTNAYINQIDEQGHGDGDYIIALYQKFMNELAVLVDQYERSE